MKKKIELNALKYVISLNIKPNLKGYTLLVDAISIGAKSPELLHPMSKRLFSVISEKTGYSVRCIERNIRRAIDIAFDSSPECFQRYFPYLKGKPYMTEVISFGAEIICRGLFQSKKSAIK